MRAPTLLVLLLAPGLAGATVYKCTDAQDRVQYAQAPIRGATCEATGVAPPPDTGANVDEMVQHAGEIDEARRQEAAEQERAGQDQAAREQRCRAARARLAMLEQSHRLFSMNEKGERDYRSDAEKQQLTAEAREAVAAECE